MPPFNQIIQGFAQGDDLTIRRTINNLPSGQTIVEAWLTVKLDPKREPDVDAIIGPKSITTVLSGSGQVTDDGATDGVGEVEFFVLRAETVLMIAGERYTWDIQIEPSASNIYTAGGGKIVAKQQVTRVTI